MATHNFNARQSYEREIKDIYSEITINEIPAAEATIATTEPIVLESVAIGDQRNGDTFTVEVAAAAANPTDTVLAVFTGDADDIICTVTPNNGLNNPDAAAEAVLNLTADITLESVAAGTPRNTNTFTIQVIAAAPNPTDTVLVAFTGTAAAIVCTVTPNDGTNNAATPVALTTAELAELINTGLVAGKTITLTDASSRRVLQTATGGGATPLADAGEGDGVVGTFSGGTDTAVDLTTEELVELINDGSVVGKTVTVTDVSSLRALQTATGGDTEVLANGGEGDGEVGTFSGGDSDMDISEDRGISSVVRNDVGDFTITLSNKFAYLKYMRLTLKDSTAADLRMQIHTDSVATDGTIRFMTLTGATKTDPAATNIFQIKLEVKDSGVAI